MTHPNQNNSIIRIFCPVDVDHAVKDEAGLKSWTDMLAESSQPCEDDEVYTCPLYYWGGAAGCEESYAKEYTYEGLTDAQEGQLVDLIGDNTEWTNIIKFFSELGYQEKEDDSKFEPELKDLADRLADGDTISDEESAELKDDTYEEIMKKAGMNNHSARWIFWSAAQNLATVGGEIPDLAKLKDLADGETPYDAAENWKAIILRSITLEFDGGGGITFRCPGFQCHGWEPTHVAELVRQYAENQDVSDWEGNEAMTEHHDDTDYYLVQELLDEVEGSLGLAAQKTREALLLIF